MPANSGPARAIATRTFPSPRGSFRRATARRSWPSTNSCAPPTTSPTIRRCRRKRSSIWLDRLEADLLGERRRQCRRRSRCARALAERGLSPQHAQDLLKAFRLDATKLRYRDWDDLMGYCTYSAMPVGRFVLDVHGESRAHLAGLRRDLRGAADHQPPAGLRRRLPQSRPRLSAARCACRAAASTSRHSARPRRRRHCAPASPAWRSAPTRCCNKATCCRAWSQDLRLALETLGHPHAGAAAHRASSRSAIR